MCYAIPGKVESIDKNIVIVDYFGEKKKAVNELINLSVGDYIYAQGGFVISVVQPEEAETTLSIWKDLFFELKDIDSELTGNVYKIETANKKLSVLLDKAAQGLTLTNEDLIYLLGLEDPAEVTMLYKTANLLRQKHLGNSCCIHGIIEFSNACKEDCGYCGISIHNTRIERYRMKADELVDEAVNAIENYGFKALVLQSAEDPNFNADQVADVIRRIKERAAVLIFISCGEVGIDGLQKLYDAGARGLLMRFETSSPTLYERIHSKRKLSTRLEHLRAAYKMGYLIVTGGLIGLPGQSKEDILNDILLAKELHAEMYSFGPFLPHPDTPLRDYEAPKIQDILKTLAISRIVDPENAKILVTTGYETLSPSAREDGLMAGANSVMLTITPEKYKKLYHLYPNRAHLEENLQDQIDHTLSLLKKIGRAPTDLGIASENKLG